MFLCSVVVEVFASAGVGLMEGNLHNTSLSKRMQQVRSCEQGTHEAQVVRRREESQVKKSPRIRPLYLA